MKRFLAALFLVVTVTIAYAHPGGTDGQGHYNRSTGEYHYHHGYPEHQHYGGECPYDFDDKTGQSSGSSSSSSNTEERAASISAKKEKTPASKILTGIGHLFLFVICGGWFIFWLMREFIIEPIAKWFKR